MAENRGVAPPDLSTDIGRLRVQLGDIHYTPLDPPEVGLGLYQDYSDEELEYYLEQGDSIEGAMYRIYLQMAGSAARNAKNIQDLDLRINTEKRAESLLAIANAWKAQAEALSADIFELFDTVSRRCRHELAEGVSCRRGCNGSGLF